MKETGIIRRIDDLGRIAIPKEIRREVLGKSDCTDITMEFFVDEDAIVIKPYKLCDNVQD